MVQRSMKWEKPEESPKSGSDEPVQKTGLNYIELVYEKYQEQQKLNHQNGFVSLMEEGETV
jgi:hypothetical protein